MLLILVCSIGFWIPFLCLVFIESRTVACDRKEQFDYRETNDSHKSAFWWCECSGNTNAGVGATHLILRIRFRLFSSWTYCKHSSGYVNNVYENRPSKEQGGRRRKRRTILLYDVYWQLSTKYTGNLIFKSFTLIYIYTISPLITRVHQNVKELTI